MGTLHLMQHETRDAQESGSFPSLQRHGIVSYSGSRRSFYSASAACPTHHRGVAPPVSARAVAASCVAIRFSHNPKYTTRLTLCPRCRGFASCLLAFARSCPLAGPSLDRIEMSISRLSRPIRCHCGSSHHSGNTEVATNKHATDDPQNVEIVVSGSGGGTARPSQK